jgi:hypothetical protein
VSECETVLLDEAIDGPSSRPMSTVEQDIGGKRADDTPDLNQRALTGFALYWKRRGVRVRAAGAVEATPGGQKVP